MMDDVRVNGYRCTHPAILALVQQDGGGRSAEDVVRDKARRTITETHDVLSAIDEQWAPPPYDPFLIAQTLGIRCVASDVKDLGDAMLVVEGGMPTVFYNPDHTSVRTRFSIFHEIAHTFFPGYETSVNNRPQRRPSLFEAEGQLEYLCDLAATEMLLPRESFEGDLEERGFTAEQIPRLCERYGASVEAVCRRIIDCCDDACAFVRLDYRRKKPKSSKKKFIPDSESSFKNMRINYTVCTDAFRDEIYSLPKYLFVPGTSCIHTAAWENRPSCGEELLDLGKGKQWYSVEAVPLSYHRRYRAYSPVCVFFYSMCL